MLDTYEKKDVLGTANIDAAAERLLYQGFKLHGDGHFSKVYMRESDHTVVKLGRRARGDGWVDYARAITRYGLADKNTAFHRIHWVAERTGFDGLPQEYIAELEPLRPLVFEFGEGGAALKYPRSSTARILESYMMGHSARTGQFSSDVYDALDYINGWNKAHWDNSPDLHGGNIMLRDTPEGEQLVITDPLA